MRAIIASAYDRLPVARTDTRIVPAMAVPKDEPRFEMLRDRPEISPCSSSGKLDCTTFTEGVSMTPRPRPISRSPGTKARMLSELDQADQEPMPASVHDEAGHDQGLLRAPLGKPLRSEGGEQDAERRRREDDAGLDRVVAANDLEIDGDDE